jgi:hypothetical protein
MPRVCLDNGKPAKDDANGDRKCKEVSFHSLICLFLFELRPISGLVSQVMTATEHRRLQKIVTATRSARS